MNKYAIFVLMLSLFNFCNGMEKEPSFWGKLFYKEPVKKEIKIKVDNTGKILYECNICFNSFEKLLITACKHEMCAACLGNCAITANNRCPWCNQDIVKASISQYSEGRIKDLQEKCTSLEKTNNEQLIQINMLKLASEQLNGVKLQLQQKTEYLDNLVYENTKLSAVIHAGVFLRCLMPLVSSKESSLIASIATVASIGLGTVAAQILIATGDPHSTHSLYCQKNRSKSFLNQFFLMHRINRIGLWTTFFNSMLEMPWKQRLIISALGGAGLEAVDILLMQKTNDRRLQSSPCNLVGLAGISLGLGINTLAAHLKVLKN